MVRGIPKLCPPYNRGVPDSHVPTCRGIPTGVAIGRCDNNLPPDGVSSSDAAAFETWIYHEHRQESLPRTMKDLEDFGTRKEFKVIAGWLGCSGPSPRTRVIGWLGMWIVT